MQWSWRWILTLQTNNSVSLSHTHSTHQLGLLIPVCLSLLRSSLYGIFMFCVRQERNEVLNLLPSSHTLINTRWSAQREISRQGTLQWISVLTQVIAFLLWSLRVLILLRKVCSRRVELYLSSWFLFLTGPCKRHVLHFPEGSLEIREMHTAEIKLIYH